MGLTKFALFATGVSAFFTSPALGDIQQQPLLLNSASVNGVADFNCDLPPVLEPKNDGLASSSEVYSSKAAFDKQLKRHQAIVRVPSVSYDDFGSFEKDPRWKTFDQLHRVLEDTYPTLHKLAKVEKVNKYGLVYTVQGSKKNLRPLLLTAHQDVVPAGDPSAWTHPPFDAVFDGEWLWGRGSSDDKNSLTGLLSVLEDMLSNKEWKPRRTIIIASGFDEECSGRRGAGEIGKFLTERYGNDSIVAVLDEGGFGRMKIGNVVYAMPGVMEKGHVDIWFTLRVAGGHSSKPFPHTGIGIIAQIINKLEDNPYEAKLTKENPTYGHLTCQARYSPDAEPEVTRLLKEDNLEELAQYLVEKDPNTQFSVQTSQAVDIIAGGEKINAMPELVTLGVNYRVAAHDSILGVQQNIVRYIQDIANKYKLKVTAFADDKAFQDAISNNRTLSPDQDIKPRWDIDYKGSLVIETKDISLVAPTSPTSGPVWDIFSGTIQHTFAFDNGTVVPTGEGMTGNTDTRHYLNLSRNVYRFVPRASDAVENIHAVDERLRFQDHMNVVRFYYDYIRNFDAADV